MRSDAARLMVVAGEPRSAVKRLFWRLQPNAVALSLYRLYHHLHQHGWRSAALLLYTLNIYLTRIEIPPATLIGEACFIGHFPIVLCGRIGDRFTFFGDGGTGGGFSADDIGGGPGLPVIGDDVTMAIRALVLGPVHVGDGARLGPSCTVTRDVPAGATVAAPLSRIVQGGPSAQGAPSAAAEPMA